MQCRPAGDKPWALRKNIEWKESVVLIFGGLFGVPVAVWLLQHTDAGHSEKVSDWLLRYTLDTC
jgi:uncharacterized membrane protein YfcA